MTDTVEKGPSGYDTGYVYQAVSTNDYGYWGGGYPGPLSTVRRLDYSNDSVAGLIRGNLTISKYGLGTTGNKDFGLFAGGNPGTV